MYAEIGVLTHRAVCKATNHSHPLGFSTAKFTPEGAQQRKKSLSEQRIL